MGSPVTPKPSRNSTISLSVRGTDWPHSNVYEPGKVPNDGDLMNMMLDLAPDEAVRNRILADNALRLFGFR